MSGKDVPWPVLVRIGEAGAASYTTALMNRKAYRKSLETGIPWVVHPATGRVLSWPGDPEFVSLEEGPGRFELALTGDAPTDPYGPAPPPEADPDDRSDMRTAGAEAAGASNGGPAASGGADVMDRLSGIIADRRRTMPEGSYTTLLFEKGLDKIRKKAGEEAVELLLARDSKDVVYEAADLIYHLLVLLEASDVSWSDVIGELDRRHG